MSGDRHDQSRYTPVSGDGMPPPLPDRLRLPLTFDAAALRTGIDRLPAGAWTDHFVPDHYTGRWQALPLRAPVGALHPILRIAPRPDITDWADTELLAASPALAAALARLACPLLSARLMRLAAGSTIAEHRDGGLDAAAGSVRLHIPIVTNAQVEFRLNGTPVAMAAGECWYLRLADPHSVANRGAEERIHLVVDATVNAWLAELLIRADARPVQLKTAW